MINITTIEQAVTNPTNALIVSVMGLLGAFLKRSTKLDNRYIPAVLAGGGAVLSVLCNYPQIHSVTSFIETAFAGGLYAAVAVGGHSGLQHVWDVVKTRYEANPEAQKALEELAAAVEEHNPEERHEKLHAAIITGALAIKREIDDLNETEKQQVAQFVTEHTKLSCTRDDVSAVLMLTSDLLGVASQHPGVQQIRQLAQAMEKEKTPA
ncbi:phage holin family protein [Tumebacillus flagellatus]|uniref:Holin n=1 Tax=Tumebacillus flagellatus TaxID=1157490 RepID=A0A074LL60_9BACL|nr:phage holin family protein [Tumebacillus flagellatus]KEO81295.1 hypothetical protein EL26_21720 [Tumebacillus flagellatus]